MRSIQSRFQCALALALLACAPVQFTAGAPVWAGYAGNAQHDANSTVASDSLQTVSWSTPVDLAPQFSGNDLFIHYGSPMITQANTVIVPVKTGASGGFQLSAFNGATGASLWTQSTDYVLPPTTDWTPSYSPTLTPNQRLYFAGSGGTVYYRDSPDSASASTINQLAFYGLSNYTANKSAFDNSIYIDTPITSDSAGNIYFGFKVTGSNPQNLQGGIARISASGTATYSFATSMTGNSSLDHVAMNSAPAISRDGNTVYVAVSNGTSGSLVALNATTLAVQHSVNLIDPTNGSAALLDDSSTSSPTIGTDGQVYFGVLGNPLESNHARGYLLHFSADLQTTKTPGAFGWDDTATVVPASMVKSYKGTSQYLIMTKYNNYVEGGGDGNNKLAILDPNDTETDPVTGTTVMKEILTISGVTPDSEHSNISTAVREWCINNAVVDPATDSILANSEDGKLYRWDLGTNTFTEAVTLTAGVGEAYTPTLIGADGTVYAINDATLFAVTPEPATLALAVPVVCVLLLQRKSHPRRVAS